MRKHRFLTLILTTFLVGSATLLQGQRIAAERDDLQSQQAAIQVPPPLDQSVPADLRPLLTPRQSEMRLVTQRYNADRATLNGNYDRGGAGGRGGRGAGAVSVPGLSLSTNRIARLKRYDMDWQAALARLTSSRLSAAAQTDLNTLKTTIQANLEQLDADAAVIAQIMPLLPLPRKSSGCRKRASAWKTWMRKERQESSQKSRNRSAGSVPV